jgi:hypothetical protein
MRRVVTRAPVAAALVSSIALACCNLVSGADGLSVAEDEEIPTPPRETQTHGAEAGTNERRETDGGPIGAGFGDAGGDAVAPPGAFCATSAATFCADFDQGQRNAGWSGSDETGGGTLLLDTARSVSAPASLRSTLPARDVAGSVYQDLLRSFASTWRPVRIELDVWIEPIAWGTRTGSVALAEVYWVSANDAPGQLLELTKDGPRMTTVTTSAGAPVFTNASAPLAASAWNHVVIEADAKAAGASVKAWFGGKLVVDRSGFAFQGGPSTTIEVWIGLARYERPTPAFDVRYDNVQITLL